MVDYQSNPAAIFASLGSPVRCAIIERLRVGETRVTDLARPFPMTLAAVSKHVQVLERAGVVRRRIAGREHWLALDPQPLDDVRRWLAADEAFWKGRLDALDAALSAAHGHRKTERSA